MATDHQNGLLDIFSLEFSKYTLSCPSFSVISFPFYEDSFWGSYPKGVAPMVSTIKRLRGADMFQKCLYILFSLYLCETIPILGTSIHKYIARENILTLRYDNIIESERDLGFYTRNSHMANI
jgi:hypothetical protein